MSTIRAALAEWLDAERESFLRSARALELPLVMQVERTVGEPTGDSGTMYSQRVESVSIANHVIMRTYIFAEMESTGESIARAVLEEYGQACSLEQQRQAFDNDPVAWVQANVVL